jgi:hypothetical protein
MILQKTGMGAMTETIQWHELTPAQRDQLVHIEIMHRECPGEPGKHQCIYADGTPPTVWWYCSTCQQRWLRNVPTEEMHSAEVVPAYTTSLDATWEMLRHLIGNHSDTYERARRFFKELGGLDGPVHVIVGWADFRDLTADSLCVMALRAMGYEVLTEERS